MSTEPRKALAAAFLALGGLAAPAAAERLWAPDGAVVSTQASTQRDPRSLPAPGGGVYVVWVDSRNFGASGLDIYAIRLDANGAVAAGWPSAGVVVSASAGEQKEPRPVPDGAGGFVVTWEDNSTGDANLFAQRVDGAGTRLWAPADGVVVTTGPTLGVDQFQVTPAVVGNTVLFGYVELGSVATFYAQALDLATGGRLFNQNAGFGVFLASATTVSEGALIPSMGSAGGLDGGIIALVSNLHGVSDLDIYALRVATTGMVQWFVPLATGPGRQGGGSGFDARIAAASDGSGGAYIVWEDTRSFANTDIYGSRLSSAGLLVAGWSENGTGVCTAPNDQTLPFVAADPAAGMVAVWHDKRNEAQGDIFGQRLSPAGVFQWGAFGVQVSTPGAGGAGVQQGDPEVAINQAGSHVLAAWDDARDGGPGPSLGSVYAQALTIGGAKLFPDNDLRTAADAAINSQRDKILSQAGADFAVVWEDDRNAGTSAQDIFAQKISTTPQSAPPATPGTRIWKGTPGGLASAAANWVGGVVPGSGDYVIFGATNPLNYCTWDLVGVTLSSVSLKDGYAAELSLTSALNVTGPVEILSPAALMNFLPNAVSSSTLGGPITVTTGTLIIHQATVVAIGSVTMRGTLEIRDGAVFKGKKILIQSLGPGNDGLLKVHDVAGLGAPLLTSTGATSRLFIEVDGRVDITSATFGRLDPQGLMIAGIASIVNNRISSVTFSGPLAPGATAINFFDGGLFVSTFTNIDFADANIGANVVSAVFVDTMSRITMRGASGPRAGPAFESDAANVVDWPEFGGGGGPLAFSFTGDFNSGGAVIASTNGQKEVARHVFVDTVTPAGFFFYTIFHSTSGALGDSPGHVGVVKYDNAGVLLGSVTLQGASGGDAMAMDAVPNLYIGEKNADETVTWITKLDKNLNFVASVTLNASVVGNVSDLVWDTDGNALFGCLDGGMDNQPKVVKFDSGLVAQATATYAAAPNRNCDAITVNAVGMPFAVFASSDAASRRLVKYSNSLGSTLAESDITSLAPSIGGLAYVGGAGLYMSAVSADKKSVFVRKFDTSGNYTGTSATVTAGAPAPFDFADISAGTDGNLYVVAPSTELGARKFDTSLVQLGSAPVAGLSIVKRSAANEFVAGANPNLDAVTLRLSLAGGGGGGPPTSGITSPTQGSVVTSLMNISGTAADADGISEVRVSIQRQPDGKYWDGANYVAAPIFLQAAGGSNWSLFTSSGVNVGTGTWIIVSRASDTTGSVQAVFPVGISSISVTRQPTIPVAVTVLNRSSNTLEIGWADGANPPGTFYHIHFQTSTGCGDFPSLVGSPYLPQTSQMLAGLLPDTSYWFSIHTLDDGVTGNFIVKTRAAGLGVEPAPFFQSCGGGGGGPGGGGGHEGGLAIEFDNAGNLWEIIQDSGTTRLSKFTSGGSFLSSTTLPGAVDFAGWSLEFDSSDNAYAVGAVSGPATVAADMSIFKVGANGGILNQATFNSPYNRNDFALGSDTDTAGNIWIAGAMQLSGSIEEPEESAAFAAALWKFVPGTGVLTKTTEYFGLGGFEAFGDVAVDQGGNKWVIGFSSNPGNQGGNKLDLALWKYGPAGGFSAGPFTRPAYARTTHALDAVLALSSSAIFAATVRRNSLDNQDFAFLKYDMTGSTQAEKSWHYAGDNGDEEPAAITFDPVSGDLFIAGTYGRETPGEGLAVWRYTQAGQFVSAETLPGQKVGKGIAINSAGAKWVATQALNPVLFFAPTFIASSGEGLQGGITFARSVPLAPASLGASVNDQRMLSLRLWTEGGSAPLNSMRLSLLGDAPASQVTGVVFKDNNKDDVKDGGDAFLGAVSFAAGSPPTANVAFAAQTLDATTQHYLLMVSYSNVPAGKDLELSVEFPSDLGTSSGTVSGSGFPHKSGKSKVTLELYAKPEAQPGGGYPTPSTSPISGGFDTGLFVNNGQQVSVQAAGLWSDGVNGTFASSGTGLSGGLVPGNNRGALIGRIGSGAWFLLGATSTTTATGSGNLFLAMSDDNYSNNAGSITITYQLLLSTGAKTWVGGNASFPNKASIDSNWAGGQKPFTGDRVRFAASGFDCDWDLSNITVASLDVTTGYAKVLRLVDATPGIPNTLTISSHASLSGGVLDLGGGHTLSVQGDLIVNGSSATLDLGTGGSHLQVKGLTLKGGAFLRNTVPQAAGEARIENLPGGALWSFNVQDATITVTNHGPSLFNPAVVDISSLAAINVFDRVTVEGSLANTAPSVKLHAGSPVKRVFDGWEFLAIHVSSNVDASDVAAGSTVTFTNASGSRFGTPFERDPFNVVSWQPDGGATGVILGTVSYGGAAGGEYRVRFSTDSSGALGGLAGTVVVSSGNVGYILPNLAAPNTWYVFAFKSPGPVSQPAGNEPRGGVGNPGSFRSNAVFVPAGANVGGQNITLQDWGSVSGQLAINTTQVGASRVQAWLGAGPCSTCTLEASITGPPSPGGFYFLNTKPGGGYTILGFIDVNNNNLPDAFEAQGSSSVVEVVALADHANTTVTITGGSAAAGGSVSLTTAAAHNGAIGANGGTQALLRLKLNAQGSDATLSAIGMEYTGVIPPAGVYLKVIEDSNQNNQFDGCPGCFGDGFRGQFLFTPGNSTGTVTLSPADTIFAGSTRTYFIAVDLFGSKVPVVGVRISSSSKFGLSAGAMANQAALYPVESTAAVRFDVPASVFAYPDNNGGVFTGFHVDKGQSLEVAAGGVWFSSFGATGVGPGGSGATGLNTVLLSAKVGELIGRIHNFGFLGSGPWFRVGASSSVAVDREGELVLAFNDLVGSYSDNSGSVQADFSVTGATSGAIAGTVYYTGGVAGNLLVAAHREQFGPPPPGAPPASSTVTVTLSAGTTYYPYLITGLSSGKYNVTAVVQSSPTHRGDSVSKFHLVVGSTITVDVNVFLGTNSITGSLTYNGVLTFGSFFIGVTTSTNFEHEVEFWGEASTPAAGAYAIGGLLAPNTYFLVSFRDGNGNFEPEGAEPIGYFGVPGGAISNFGAFLTPIFVPNSGVPVPAIDVTLNDNGAFTGQVSLPAVPGGGNVLLEASRGVPGSPNFFTENREFLHVPPSPNPASQPYTLGLLRPATDYSLFAFLDSNFDGKPGAGEPSFNSQPNLSVPSGGSLVLNFGLVAAAAPPPVTGLKGVAGLGNVEFQWNLVQGATQYELRNAGGGVMATLPHPTSAFVFVLADNTPAPVTGITATNFNGTSSSVTIPTVFSLASVPVGLATGTVTDTSVVLSWGGTNPVGTLFELSRSSAAAAPFSPVLSTTQTNVTNGGLAPQTTYFWFVKAVNLNGVKTLQGNTVSTLTLVSVTPSIAGSVSYAGQQPSSVTVQAWGNASFAGAAASATVVLPNVASQRYYMALTAGTSYFVRAFVDVNGDGLRQAAEDSGHFPNAGAAPSPIFVTGALSGFDFAISVDTVAPAAPVGLVATPGFKQVKLSWTAPAKNANGTSLIDLAGFLVQRSTVSSFPAGSLFAATVATTSFTDPAPLPGVSNFYRVLAQDLGKNQSAPSGSVSAAPSVGGSISGFLRNFAAPAAGSFRIRLSTFSFPNAPFLAESALSTYTFDGLTDANYFLRGFQDQDNDGREGLGEPGGTFGGLSAAYPVPIIGGNSVGGADVAICDRTRILVGSPVARSLSSNDCPAKDKGAGHVTDLYAFPVGDGSFGSVGLGSEVYLVMTSTYDNELILLGPNGQVVSRDNRPGGANIRMVLNEPGVYLVEATSFFPGQTGPYKASLSVTGGFAGVVGGTVTYGGSLPGVTNVLLFDNPDKGAFPIQAVKFPAAPPVGFSFGGLPDRTYYLRAFRDANGNGVKDPGEPSGVFGLSESSPTAVSVTGGVVTPSGPLFITLSDPAVGAVKGAIIYEGTQSGAIRIEAGTRRCPDCEDLDVVAFASTGTGNSFFLDFIPPATNYVVRAYMDGNLNRDPDVLEAHVSSSPVNVVANATTTVNVILQDPGAGASGNGTIVGTIFYSGSSSGTIFVGFTRDQHFGFIDYFLTLSTQGAFLKAGVLGGTTYFMAAFRDVNGNSNPDDLLGEPIGVGKPEGFAGTPSFDNPPSIFVPLSGSVTAELTLNDPPAGLINGRVTYGGGAPLDQRLVVQAFVRDGAHGPNTFQSVSLARAPGVSEYNFSLPFLAAATNYAVMGFIDANFNNHSDFGEPFGQFGFSQCSGFGPCFGAPVNVSSGPNTFPTYGVNFTVSDPGAAGPSFSDTGHLTGEVVYVGVQGGPMVVRCFNNASYSGTPLFSIAIPGPSGPGEFHFDRPGAAFGDYFCDAFRDTGGTGQFNPTFHAYVQFEKATLDQTRTYQNLDAPLMVDPGQGGSVNAYTGSFADPGGSRFDGGAADVAFSMAMDTSSAGAPLLFVTGQTSQNQGPAASVVKYSSAGVFLASATIVSGNPPSMAVDPAGRLFIGDTTEIDGQDYPLIRRYGSALGFEASVVLLGGDIAGDVISHNGFIYVMTDNSAAIRKLNPDTLATAATGTFVFPAQGTAPSNLRAMTMAVDRSNGNIFAMVRSGHDDFGNVTLLLRFGPNLDGSGPPLQKDITHLNPPRNAGMTVDSAGNLFVTWVRPDETVARSFKFGSNLDHLATASPLQIINHFNGSFNNIQTDANGFVYEAWESTANAGDFGVFRFDNNLNLVGSRTFDGLNNTLEDLTFSLQVKDSSNVFVTGSANNGRNLDWATIRLNMTTSGAASAAGQAVVITSNSATSAIFGEIHYDGALVTSGTIRTVLLPFESNTALRISSAAFGAKRPYLFNSLPPGTYRIQAFIDRNSNFLVEAGEPVFFSTDTGIHFTGATLADMNITLCDRRTILPGVDVQDALTLADCPAPDREGARQRLYTFDGTRGQQVTIELLAKTFYDSYLTLYGPDGRLFATDDESAGNGNARIQNFILPAEGLYTIGASAFAPGTIGDFKLSLEGSESGLGSIAGRVDYTGSQGGQIVVGLFDSTQFSSTTFVDGRILLSTRVFSFASLRTGTTYFLGAFVDTNFNTNPDFGEDGNVFGSEGVPTPLFLQNGQNIGGLVLLINPSSAAAQSQAFVTGSVSYAGSRAGRVLVEFWSNASFTGRPVAVRELPGGPGPYDVSVPGGVSYFVRAFMDSSNDFLPSPDEPKGLYSPNNQGAEPIFAAAGTQLVNIDVTLNDPGAAAGGAGIAGEGAATLSPSTAAAGSAVFVATITYTAGANGIQTGGRVGFIVPPGFSFPQFVTAASTSGATLSAVSFSGPSAFVTVTGGGGLLAGQQLRFIYDKAFVPCFIGTATFNVASAQNGNVTPQPLFAGSPTLQVLAGEPAMLVPGNPYMFLREDILSERQTLEARDFCGNKSPVASAKTAYLRAKRFDFETGAFAADATLGLSSAATVAPTVEIALGFAVGQSSRSFFALATSTGFKNIELFSNLLNESTFYYGLTVLLGDALTKVSVATFPAGVGRSSVTITPNNDGASDQAFINFKLGDPDQGWHILVSSIPYKSGVEPRALWERWGFGQPAPGEIAWDGRFSPWLNNGGRVPNGLYYIRVEVGGSGVRDDGISVRVDVPQLSGRFFDSGLTPNPPLSGAKIQLFGPNGQNFTQTDANGQYFLPGISAGTYRMQVGREDFLDGSLGLTVTGAGVVSTFTALSNAVSASLTNAGSLDILMSRAPVLFVVPSLGVGFSTQPVDQWGGLQVRTSTSAANQQVIFGPLRLKAGTTTFDDGGQWDPASQQFVTRTLLKFNVAVGTYTIEAFFGGAAPSSATVFVSANGATVFLPAFARKSSVSGLVTLPANANGTFVSVNAVLLSTLTAGGGFGGVSLPPGVLSGTYTVANLDAGAYLLRANTFGFSAISTGPIAVPASSEVTKIDFPAFSLGAEIKGNITVLGDTSQFPSVAPGVPLRAYVNAWSPGSLNFGSTVVVVSAGVDIVTPYSMKGLDAGTTYQVFVNLEHRGDVHFEAQGSQPFLKAAQVAPADLNVTFAQSSGAIVGTILLPPGNTDFLNVSLFGRTIDSPRPEDVGHEFQIKSSTELPGFACFPGGGGAPTGFCAAGSSTATFTVQGLNTETDDVTLFYKTTGETKKLRISIVNGSTTTVFVSLAGQTFSISGSINNQITNSLFNTNPKIVANAPFIPLRDKDGVVAPGLSSSTARVLAIRQDISQFSQALSQTFDPATTRVGFLTSAGTFSVTNVPAGVYFVRTEDLRACATCPVEVPTVGRVVRVSNANVSSVTFTLSDGFNVSGSVSLDGGLQDSRVFELTVINRRQEVVRSTQVFLGNAALGQAANSVDYSFENLPANAFYTITVRDLGSPAKYAGRPIKFPDPGLSPNGLQSNLVSQNILLQRAAFIIGRMKDLNTGELINASNVGLLAPNFRISATANPWVEGGFVLAASSVSGRPVEADGFFRVGPLFPNVSYDVKLAQASWDSAFLARGSQNYAPVTLSGLTPQPAEVKDVGVVALSQGQSLTGTVRQSTTTGALLGNIKITAKPSYGFTDLKVETFTSPLGRYTLWVSSAVSNQYDVTAAPRDGNMASNGLVYGEVTLRSVSLLATATADFLLEPLLAKVTGQVVVEDAASGGELSYPFGENKGFPAAALNLQLFGVIPTKSPLGDIEAATDEQGRFEILGLSTGTFSMNVVSLGYSIFKATVTTTATAFRIFTGSDTPANYVPNNVMTLKKGATVSGRIIKSDGSSPNDTEVGGVAAANFSQNEFVVGSVEVDPSAKTVQSYAISGFKTGVNYDIVILPKNEGDDIAFPPEGEDISFSAGESTATKNINLTFISTGFDCVPASKKALGNNQFQIKIECSKPLRKKIASDDDLDLVLTVSTFTSQNAAMVAPNGTGQLLGADKVLSGNRRQITAIYGAVANETNFSLRLRSFSQDVNPKDGENFYLDKVFDFFVGLDSNATKKISNIQGGSAELEPTAEDEAKGLSERARIDLAAGTFADEGSGNVVVASKTVELGLSKGRDQALAKTLALKYLGYAPQSLEILSNLSAFPPEMASAMAAYRSLASTSTVGGANPLSSFYSIFLPAGIRHQLNAPADLTLSFSLVGSSVTNLDSVNVWFFNATLGKFVMETVNRRVDAANQTITVTVDHLSTFVVLDSTPVASRRNVTPTAEIMAVNFPNPSDCVVHSNVPVNSALFGPGGGVHAPFTGTMIRFTLPGADTQVEEAKINVYNVAGELVRSMRPGAVQGGFTHYVPWDCRNDSGRTISSGVYIGEVVWGGKRKFFKMAIIKGSGL